MRKLFATAASIALAVGISLPASAAIITRAFNFTATDFASIPADGQDARFTSVSGSFTVTADPDLNYQSETAGLTIHTLSFPAPGGPMPSAIFRTREASGSVEQSIWSTVFPAERQISL